MKPKLLAPPADDPGAKETLADRLPLYSGSPPRPLFFKELGFDQRATLQAKGYDPKSVFELPRGEVQDEVNYLLAKAQGIEEGTIFASDEEIRMLEIEMKAAKLLGNREVTTRVTLNVRGKEAKEILASWRSSRHTLRGNSTVVSANLSLPARSSVSPIEGVKRGGKVSKAAQRNQEQKGKKESK